LISQVINLSNEKAFSFYQQKYKFNFPNLDCNLGVEIRALQNELFKEKIIDGVNNIFISDDRIIVTGSANEILNSISKNEVPNEMTIQVKQAIEK